MQDLINTLYLAYIDSAVSREDDSSYKECSAVEHEEYHKLISLLNQEQREQLERFQQSAAATDEVISQQLFLFAMRVGAQLYKLLLEKPVSFDPA
ncbi:MAG: hypothetical protein HFE39_10800 [Clostridiales bacterium]|nr:hypothetical protein [Clostridiales bacterium]